MLIEAPLTGARTYIHGADIFDAAVGLTGAESGMVLTLRLATDCAIELRDATSPGAAAAAACGTFAYRRGREWHRHALLRRPDRPITTRLPCDDDALVAGAVMVADRATAPALPDGATCVRRVCALGLAVLQRAAPGGYWTVAEIACAHLPPRDAAIAVAIRDRVGDRFWKVATWAAGAELGHVVVARGSPRR